MPRKAGQSSQATQESVLDLSGDTQGNSQSQNSQADKSKKRQSTDNQVDINSPEFKRKVSEMVRCILFADRKKTGIKRTDLVKNVLKENPRSFNKVFSEACLKINQTFGFDVVPMETEDGKSLGLYILINALDDGILNNEFKFLDWDKESPRMGLVLIILSMIFMNDGALTDNVLWYTLQKLGISKEKSHKVYGDVDKLINTEFTKHHYLKKNKVNGPEGPTFCYSFGSRARKEISKRKILEFVSEIYGFDDISKWNIQYEDIVNEENGQDEEMEDLSQNVGN